MTKEWETVQVAIHLSFMKNPVTLVKTKKPVEEALCLLVLEKMNMQTGRE